MAKLSTMRGSLTQSVLVFGPPKVGKTQLAGELATHPEIAGIIWIDLENGVETLMKLPMEFQEKIHVIQLPDTKSNPVGIETCLKIVRGIKVNICEEHGVVDCAICKKARAVLTPYELGALPANWVVVFDSLTQLTDSAIAYITKGKPDDYKMQTDDWGDLQKLMGVFLSHIQQAKFNVICISHETEAEREDGTTRVVAVAGSRNTSRNSAKYFGHVVYAEVKAKKHMLTSSTTGNSNVVAGSRADIRLEDIKDGSASLFPIFAASARAASVGSKIDTAEAETVTDLSVKTEVQEIPEAPKEAEIQGIKEDLVIIDDVEGAPPTDHVALMAAMTPIERIRYKRANGL